MHTTPLFSHHRFLHYFCVWEIAPVMGIRQHSSLHAFCLRTKYARWLEFLESRGIARHQPCLSIKVQLLSRAQGRLGSISRHCGQMWDALCRGGIFPIAILPTPQSATPVPNDTLTKSMFSPLSHLGSNQGVYRNFAFHARIATA